jgi:hypothetical protein
MHEEVVQNLPDNAQWRNRFKIRSSSSNRLYTIAQNKLTGQWGCDCPGYKRARNGVRKCKHLTEGCGLSLAQIHGNALTDQRVKRKAIG